MKVIAGLGNPDTKYSLNRHNVGFMLLDSFATKRKMSFSKDGNALVARRNTFTLVKPITYMNLSGRAISRFVTAPEDMIVICDDIYLPFGEVRIRKSGGDGGHNGLENIIYELISDEFPRIRIGVGQPNTTQSLSLYVLDDFSEIEQKTLAHTATFTTALLDAFIGDGYQSMLNHYSKNKKSYSESIASESQTTGGT
jgi:PTH1 family peptidyl-tRNA hydrolase